MIYCAKNQLELLITEILLIDVPLFQKKKKVSCRGDVHVGEKQFDEYVLAL